VNRCIGVRWRSSPETRGDNLAPQQALCRCCYWRRDPGTRGDDPVTRGDFADVVVVGSAPGEG
jgi:hypothetical protein